MNTTSTAPSQEKKPYITFRFMDYKVYQESKKLFQEIISLKGILEPYPELWHQLKSSIASVVMSIAGASTKLPDDAKRYLGSSITSANKAVACLDIARDFGTITSDEFQLISEGFKGVIIQLKGFIKALGASARPQAAAQLPAA